MTLGELAELLGAELVGGDPAARVLGVAGLEEVGAGEVCFVTEPGRLPAAEKTPALAVIAPAGCRSDSKPLLLVRSPRLAFARALALFAPPAPRLEGVHPTAVVGKGVELGAGVGVGPYAVVGDGARLGARVQVYPLAVVGCGVEVGEDSVIHSHVVLYDGVKVGARVIIQAGTVVGSGGFGYVEDEEGRPIAIPHVGTVVIEDEVEIGAGVTIDRGTTGATVIGRGTKIDNLVHVAHNVRIGRYCLLAGQVGISGSVVIGDGVMLAGQAGVIDHITIGAGARGGARAAITRDVPDGATVWGMPARPLAQELRIQAALGRLPELARQVRALASRLAELEAKLSDRKT